MRPLCFNSYVNDLYYWRPMTSEPDCSLTFEHSLENEILRLWSEWWRMDAQLVNFNLHELNFERAQSVTRRCLCHETRSSRSWNEFEGHILSPALGRFYHGSGRRRASAEETEVAPRRLRRASGGKDGDSDGSQHRWVKRSPRFR